MSSSLEHECAVAGAIGLPDCRELVVAQLISQQHRGHEWWGIAAKRSDRIVVFKYPGLVKDSCGRQEILDLQGDPVIGHDRYSTAGASTEINAQPHVSSDGRLAVCANGDIVPASYAEGHSLMIKEGYPLISQNDGELMLRVLEWQLSMDDDIVRAIRYVQDNLDGAFSALVIYQGELIAFRDKLGIRPLSYTKIGSGFVAASETCAFEAIGAEGYEYIRAGEIYVFHNDGTYDRYENYQEKHAHCVFELIYFSFPTSYDFGIPVCEFRKRLGAKFANLIPEDADLVIAVPDSSNFAAIGLAHASGKPFDLGIVRSHYALRSFISPDKKTRKSVAKQKLVPCRAVLEGKSVVVVDDSIVRGTTSKEIVERLFAAGAREVHVRVVSPPVKHPCFYGINTPTKEELIASNMSVEEIRAFIGATSLAYLSIEDLSEVLTSFGKPPNHHCFACFNGEYPTRL